MTCGSRVLSEGESGGRVCVRVYMLQRISGSDESVNLVVGSAREEMSAADEMRVKERGRVR